MGAYSFTFFCSRIMTTRDRCSVLDRGMILRYFAIVQPLRAAIRLSDCSFALQSLTLKPACLSVSRYMPFSAWQVFVTLRQQSLFPTSNFVPL